MADFANARGRPAPTRSSREDDQDDEPQQLLFDCSGIKSKADFWDKFLDFIGAMEDHGTNLDALADSMTGGCSDKLVSGRFDSSQSLSATDLSAGASVCAHDAKCCKGIWARSQND